MKKISWVRITIATVVVLAFMVVATGIWYWVYIWLPQKENRAMQVYFDAIEQRLRAEGKLK